MKDYQRILEKEKNKIAKKEEQLEKVIAHLTEHKHDYQAVSRSLKVNTELYTLKADIDTLEYLAEVQKYS